MPSRLRPIEDLGELLEERYALVYGQGGTVFDRQEHAAALGDMRDACLTRELHRAWAEHPERCLVRVQEVGFDPSCKDQAIQCNLWARLAHQPEGRQVRLPARPAALHVRRRQPPEELYQWVLRWIAYPLQHPAPR